MNWDGLESAAVVAAFVAASAAIWQGVLTRRALTASYDNSLAQERLVRLSNLYSALREVKDLARRAYRRGSDELSDEEARSVLSAVERVRASADMVALAFDPGKFNDEYDKVADLLVFVYGRGEPPDGRSVLEHVSDLAEEISEKVFMRTMRLNQSRSAQ